MTARGLYEAALIELSKIKAPSFGLEEFNHFGNKAIANYHNKIYNKFEINLQATDDLRVLSSQAQIIPIKSTLLDDVYEFNLPLDYLHLLNCICVFEVNRPSCNTTKTVKKSAKRMTSDSLGDIEEDYYNRPSFNNPYYYIHNVNTSNTLPTNPLLNLTAEQTYKTYSDEFDTDIDKIVIREGDSEDTCTTHYTIGDEETITDTRYYEITCFTTGSKMQLITSTTDALISFSVTLNDNTVESSTIVKLLTDDKCTLSIPTETNNDVNVVKIIAIVHSGTFKIDSIKLNLREESTEAISIYRGTDMVGTYNVTSLDGEESDVINLPRTALYNGVQHSTIKREAGNRYGNPSNVRCEIRFGSDDVKYKLKKVLVDYIKTPQYIELTQDLLAYAEDTSQVIEFPDYACDLILNELVTLVMVNTADPRLQTHTTISLTIASPAQPLSK